MARTASDAARKIGERITKLRVQAEISQRDLDDLTGIDVSNIGKYERGEALPNVGSLVRIAAAFQLDPGELIRGLQPDDLPDRPRVYTASEFVAERQRRRDG